MFKKQCTNNFIGSILTLFSGKNRMLNDTLNNQQLKVNSLPARTSGLIVLLVFCNIAVLINSPVKAANAVPPPNIDCLFNWAQTFYPK